MPRGRSSRGGPELDGCLFSPFIAKDEKLNKPNCCDELCSIDCP